MDVTVLLLEIFLSTLFLYFGLSKLFLPLEKIELRVSWARDYSHNRLKLFGLLEVLGAIGIIAPHQLNILPILTPIAATGLAMIMSGAIAVHLKRDELVMIVINIVLIFLLAGIGFNSLLEIAGVSLP